MGQDFDSHVQELLSLNSDFRRWWGELGENEKTQIKEEFARIDGVLTASLDQLGLVHAWCSKLLGKFFGGLREKDLFGYDVPNGWSSHTKDAEWLEESFKVCGDILRGLVQGSEVPYVGFYGNIKKGKTYRIVGESKIQLWDLVRFRLVGGDIGEVRSTAVSFLEESSVKCVRLRNLFLNPVRVNGDTGYRGIHLLLVLEDTHLVELQLRTRLREIVSWLDHYHTNQRFKPSSKKKLAWLRGLSYKANLLDFEDFFRKSIS